MSVTAQSHLEFLQITMLSNVAMPYNKRVIPYQCTKGEMVLANLIFPMLNFHRHVRKYGPHVLIGDMVALTIYPYLIRHNQLKLKIFIMSCQESYIGVPVHERPSLAHETTDF